MVGLKEPVLAEELTTVDRCSRGTIPSRSTIRCAREAAVVNQSSRPQSRKALQVAGLALLRRNVVCVDREVDRIGDLESACRYIGLSRIELKVL